MNNISYRMIIFINVMEIASLTYISHTIKISRYHGRSDSTHVYIHPSSGMNHNITVVFFFFSFSLLRKKKTRRKNRNNLKKNVFFFSYRGSYTWRVARTSGKKNKDVSYVYVSAYLGKAYFMTFFLSGRHRTKTILVFEIV